jgi:hypothetical protein
MGGGRCFTTLKIAAIDGVSTLDVTLAEWHIVFQWGEFARPDLAPSPRRDATRRRPS